MSVLSIYVNFLRRRVWSKLPVNEEDTHAGKPVPRTYVDFRLSRAPTGICHK